MTDQHAAALQHFVDTADASGLTLIVDTPQGPHLRRIPPALPLPTHVEHGPGAEAAAQTAAAAWGMPDFVFQQADHAAKGSGRRELGDRLLLAGQWGAVVQVKARTVAPKPDSLETAWIQKVAAKAIRQAKGTVRQLRMAPAVMVNGRDNRMAVDGHAFEWIAVFLLDHPGVPDQTVPTWQPPGMPAIALTRRDWDFLFDQLRSTTAVLDYLFRAAALPAVPLGDEPVRYYELAAADVDALPAPMSPEVKGLGGVQFSAPQLPQVPAGADGTRAHLMIRFMLEDIALTPLGETLDEADRFTLLSALDWLPVSARAEWGHLLLDMLRDVPRVPEEHCKWRFRRLVDAEGTRQVIVGAASRFDSVVQAAFSAYVQLRHVEVCEHTRKAEHTSTLGVLLTPRRRDRRRLWDTTTSYTSGELDISPEDLQLYRDTWNQTSQDLTG
ncbi:hypothetical protein ACH4SP_14680 [Streptomyces sp. NPDC021093]|uniref:hypothetical protein n=1 Tax=Streptomyces sp. NPDC021093 TaxID=3365112 RepID=UPI0037A16B25